MSAQVDVLAVMDKYLNYVLPGKLWDGNNSYCNQPGSEGSEYSADMAKLVEARTAVAALIAERDALRKALSKKVNDAEQRAFEDWLESNSPSGDHEEVQRKWTASNDYREFIDEWREQIDALTIGESA